MSLQRWQLLFVAALLTISFQTISSRNSTPSLLNGEPTGATSPVNLSLTPIARTWARWTPWMLALAEHDGSIWIGGEVGLLRVDKTTGSYQRFTGLDGLPLTTILALTEDSAAQLWVGGEGGLSRMTADGTWQTETPANSGLYSTLVDGIAATADGSLWLSHGLPDSVVSRRNPDGAWLIYPNRFAVVAEEYANILTTRNRNSLWTVAGSEIWVGYWVFDGTRWAHRLPSSTQPVGLPVGTRPSFSDADSIPRSIDVESNGRVWILESDQHRIASWESDHWLSHPVSFPFHGSVQMLTVASDDRVWIAFIRDTNPYGNEWAGVAPLGSSLPIVGRSGPVRALLPTADGVWAAGPAWFKMGNNNVIDLRGLPAHLWVNGVTVGEDGKAWIHSEVGGSNTYGALQSLDDRGTFSLMDDRWQYADTDLEAMELTAMTGGATGDIWVASGTRWRDWFSFNELLRLHNGVWYRSGRPSGNFERLINIFVQDERHVWFVSDGDGVYRLDDGGTPTITADDDWTHYELLTGESNGIVAVDAQGHPWYGDSTGLYRYEGSGWRIVSENMSICDLVPSTAGPLFVFRRNYYGVCQPSRDDMLYVMANGTSETRPLREIFRDHPEWLRSTSRRNQLWAATADGGLWLRCYSSTQSETLEYFDSKGRSMVYPWPFDSHFVPSLEVDPHGHLWLLVFSQIWRFSPTPDFGLNQLPTAWLLPPDTTRQRRVSIEAQGGWAESISVTISGLPAELTLAPTPAIVRPGEVFTLTLASDSSIEPDSYPGFLLANSGILSHTLPFTVTISNQLLEWYFPGIGPDTNMQKRPGKN